jgi:transposase
MLTWKDDMEVHALRERGWSISAIARHTGHDRKTVRKYFAGDQKPGCGPGPRRIRSTLVGQGRRQPTGISKNPPAGG